MPTDPVPCGGLARESQTVTYVLKWVLVLHTSFLCVVGSQVIEEERKRVQELKRRVQDEVRAQWEERRQREANCNSLNSVGSEESSLTSSDVPTER